MILNKQGKIKESVDFVNLNPIKVRVRLIILNEDKVLLVNNLRDQFHYLPGGKMNYGEGLMQTAVREVAEEFGEDHNFTFKKIVYLSDFIKPERFEHSFEIYVLGEINNPLKVEGKGDPDHTIPDEFNWHDVNSLPKDLKPEILLEVLPKDLSNKFEGETKYLGDIC